MISRFTYQLVILISINQLSSVYSQNEQQPSNPGHVYVSLLVLIFFLFTVFGILTAFLIKHNPRRRAVPVGKVMKDTENSEDIAFLENENPNEVSSFDFLDKSKPIIHFDEPKNFIDNENNKSPDMKLKSKLLKDYLNQQSSDEFESKSPDSLNELNNEFRGSQSPEDSFNSGLQSSPEFTEIPKDLIAKVDNRKNTNQFESPTDADTFSDTYNLSIDDQKSEKNELDREKDNDNLLMNMVEAKNSLTKLLNEQKRKNPLHSSDDSIDECTFCSDTYDGNKKKGEIEIEKMARPYDIPESSTFPSISDNESMKSTKSYHSYGFPLENPSDSLNKQSSTDLKFESSSSLKNPVKRWDKMYNMKLQKPSDYDEMMKNMNLPNSKEDVSLKDKKADEKSEKSLNPASTDSSPKFELKTIVCPPLSPDNSNAKYLSSLNDQLSIPESDLIKMANASLNESENSEYSQHNKISKPKTQSEDQQVINVLEENAKKSSAFKSLKKTDETGSLKTLNSLDTSLEDNLELKNAPSSVTQSQSSKSSGKKTSRSVLDVLEKFDKRM